VKVKLELNQSINQTKKQAAQAKRIDAEVFVEDVAQFIVELSKRITAG